MSNVGESIKTMRNRKGLSQWQVAKALGKSQAYLSYFECGYKEPSEEILQKILSTIAVLPSRNQTKQRKANS